MVHIDINPIEISYEFKEEMERVLYSNSKTLYPTRYQRYHVIVYGVDAFVSEWEREQYDYEYAEVEWRGHWETFLGESFKKWVVDNGTGTQAEE